MKYYKVIAKCGHVGKSRYYAGAFYEAADDGKEAARIVRTRPRVKHDHKDAILELAEISRADYDRGMLETRANPYFHATNAYEQYLHWDAISEYVFPERDDSTLRIWYDVKNRARYLKDERKRLCHARGSGYRYAEAKVVFRLVAGTGDIYDPAEHVIA